MKKKKTDSSSTYDNIRKRILLEDNAKEDVIIKRLAKRLKLRKRRKGGHSEEVRPAWMRKYGFDYILDFEEELHSDKKPSTYSTKVDFSRKSRGKANIYGDQAKHFSEVNSNFRVADDLDEQIGKRTLSHDNFTFEANPVKPDQPNLVSSSEDLTISLRRTVRSWLNRISDAHMPRVITALAELYNLHPRALVRSTLISEVCALLESSPVTSHSSHTWLQLDLAACITCIHVVLHAQFQHDHLIAHFVETLLIKLFPAEESVLSSGITSSILVFIASFFRFGVLSHILILDLIRESLTRNSLQMVKSTGLLCTAVGIHLRKSDLATCQELVSLATEKLQQCGTGQVELSCELENIIQNLSRKHSKEEFVVRAQHLKKQLRSWTKGVSVTEDMCLSISLSDFRNRESNGRWWLAGSACPRQAERLTVTGINDNQPADSHSTDGLVLSPEVAAAAAALGLRTATRRSLFNVLVSTSGGPDSTASALLRTCASSSGASNSQEREMVQIIMHCVMAEDPFNRFYPRVLGALLNHHRRFTMMIKCAFWDALKKPDLSVKAKSNAGRALGLLVSIFDLPLTVIKNFDFGDATESNIAFLKSTFAELCTGEYQKVLAKLMQLSAYPRLSRNCRIFMRKHFTSESDPNIGSLVLRFADNLREAESW